MQESYATPTKGAALILSFRLQDKTTLIVGSGVLAASRAFAALEADSAVIILAKGGIHSACPELQWRAQKGQVQFVDWDELPGSSDINKDADSLEAFLNATPNIALGVITDTLSVGQPRTRESAERIYHVFKARNIPVNTTDSIDLCDFSFTSSHRFEHHETGEKTSLQIGVTTNGQGCRLASRLRREIVSKLPREVGASVEKVGRMRSMAKEEDLPKEDITDLKDIADEEFCEDSGVLTPNRPVPSRSNSENASERKKRRIKWVAQVSEYWPISKLASMSESDMKEVLAGENLVSPSLGSPQIQPQSASLHFDTLKKPGRILLVGSGPGHPSLLTIATHTALTKLADLVLSDKLVPDAVLALIPKHVQIRIARKFPGNAEGAQIEMMEAAVEAAHRGLTVVRLKQGDPVVYGRAGEEVLYFRSHGFEPLVIPGVSSALAAPTFAGIPVTQRGVAESFIVCTGVGRKGKEVQLPGYERGRTLVVLMGVARLAQVISALVDTSETQRRDGKAYPLHTPIAIIERASMPDQRVISSTLKDIVRALDSSGEQRPPGMMIIGWAVLALSGTGDVGVLDCDGESGDEERVQRWLGSNLHGTVGWKVREGLDVGWESI
ncbi:uroporphyrin-III C-methyltransferase [Crassisporium funariophilum]|nr:uroporphyrin-III C-methyltransferase [Crassisporium funariophilum]